MLALFISYLSAHQLATISAISYVHKIKSFSNATKSFLIQKLLTVVSRRRKSDIRQPISCPVLHELVRSLRFTISSVFQRTLYVAVFLLAIYGFFGIRELAAHSANSVSTILQFSALQFLISDGKPHFLKLVMSEYKHNANNRPFEILIPREDCPRPVLSRAGHFRLSRTERKSPWFAFLSSKFGTDYGRSIQY